MTIEQKYISKFNFNLGKFSNKFDICIINNSFVPALSVSYHEKNKGSITIDFSVYDKIRIDTSLYSNCDELPELLIVIANIVQQFKNVIQKEPLFFINYLREINLNALNLCQDTPYNIFEFESFLTKKNKKEPIESFLNKIKENNKSSKINLLHISSDIKDNIVIDLYFMFQPIKILFKDNLYHFIFDKRDYLILDFNNSVIFLNYFFINKKSLSKLNKFHDQAYISIVNAVDDIHSDINIQIAKLMIDIQMENF